MVCHFIKIATNYIPEIDKFLGKYVFGAATVSVSSYTSTVRQSLFRIYKFIFDTAAHYQECKNPIDFGENRKTIFYVAIDSQGGRSLSILVGIG